MEAQIKESLIALLIGIKEANGQRILEETERLDGFLERGKKTLSPQLVHFLGGRSYVKALRFLGGDPEVGGPGNTRAVESCG